MKTLKKVTLLLPLTYNDGSTVPNAILEAIEDELYLAFHGWTIVGEVRGAYRLQQTGTKQVDRLLQVWVVTPEAELPALRQMVSRFGTLLEQEAMYFEIADAQVEFLPPLNDEASDA